MTEQTTNRRAGDENMQVLATKIEDLAQDMNEMKHGITKMADALTKLAIVEERQTQTILAQERAFKALERVEERQLVAGSNERLATRVADLERAEPMQAQTSKWVTAGVWGALALLASFMVQRILERVFQ